MINLIVWAADKILRSGAPNLSGQSQAAEWGSPEQARESHIPSSLCLGALVPWWQDFPAWFQLGRVMNLR